MYCTSQQYGLRNDCPRFNIQQLQYTQHHDTHLETQIYICKPTILINHIMPCHSVSCSNATFHIHTYIHTYHQRQCPESHNSHDQTRPQRNVYMYTRSIKSKTPKCHTTHTKLHGPLNRPKRVSCSWPHICPTEPRKQERNKIPIKYTRTKQSGEERSKASFATSKEEEEKRREENKGPKRGDERR